MSETIKEFARMGAVVTGPRVPDDFVAGWGHAPMSRGKFIAHHWTRAQSEPDGGYYRIFRSACGLRTVATARVPLMSEGSLPPCLRCEAKLMKEMG